MPSFDQFRVPESPPGPPQLPFWRTSNIELLARVLPQEEIAPTLIGLPTELLHHVTTFIRTKSDLRNIVALGNHRLFAVALPLLYSTMHFKIGDNLQPKIKNMLTRENEGLRHIRDIEIFAGSHYADELAAYQWPEVIINMIPKDVVRRLSWIVPRNLPRRFTHLLWQRQTALEYIEVFSRHHDSQGRLETDEPDLLEYIKTHEMSTVFKLRVVPEDVDTAVLGSAIIQTCAITTLEVDARLWHEGDAYRDMQAGHVVNPLTSTLFVHLTPAPLSQAGVLNSIKNLTLSDVDLRCAAHTWMRYVDVAKLRYLALKHCTNTDIFLGKMSTNVEKPCLRGLVVVHDLGEAPDRTIDMVEDLLIYSTPTLESLELCLRNAPRLPNVASLNRHAASLKQMTLDITSRPPIRRGAEDGEGLYYEDDDLEALLDHPHPRELLQLGLHLPPQSFEYKSFAQMSTSFTRALDTIIRKVCDICTLNVLNWPESYKAQGHRRTNCYASKLPSLQRLAADIFSRFRHYDFDTDGFVKDDLGCQLEVVSFGVREHDNREPSPVHFVEAIATSLGHEKRIAAQQNLSDLVGADLEVDIINAEVEQARSHGFWIVLAR
ncbi:hypothetical protein LTR17_018022 [Elasticomyces elasticus]|nr:hypothetical protein LTR17_018022 [Elasticomyces elasticus]